MQYWPYLALAFCPVPILALIIAPALEFGDVITPRVTVVFSPVGTIAVIFFQVITDPMRHLPHLIDSLVRVFASIRVIAAGVRSRRSEQQNKQELHSGVRVWINDIE
jgi:hypothetical protein